MTGGQVDARFHQCMGRTRAIEDMQVAWNQMLSSGFFVGSKATLDELLYRIEQVRISREGTPEAQQEVAS